MDLKTLRTEKKLTQQEAAKQVGISLRSYIMYENDPEKRGTNKYRFIIRELEALNKLDEEHGLLKRDDIAAVCRDVFSNYKVDFCYLFGSYAKGKANEKSDVDLLISGEISGLKFFGMVEELRERLHKKVDILDLNQLLNNKELLREILMDGIKIYG